MGSGISTDGALATPSWIDPDWEKIVNGDWRSARARELDKLGGPQRKAIPHGKSFAMRMEWLTAKVHDQGDQFEAALSKNPLAGRYEIIKQEKARRPTTQMSQVTAKSGPPGMHKFSVREWQNMKHTDLRALAMKQRQEKAGTAARGRTAPAMNRGQETPSWDTLHWVKDKDRQEDRAALRRKINDYYINMSMQEITKKKEEQKLERTKQLDAMKKVYKPQDSQRAKLQNLPSWRKHVFSAKKKAWKIVGALVRMQVLSHVKPSCLQRMDSFSFLIKNVLGSEMERFQDENVKYQCSENRFETGPQDPVTSSSATQAASSSPPVSRPLLAASAGSAPLQPSIHVGGAPSSQQPRASPASESSLMGGRLSSDDKLPIIMGAMGAQKSGTAGALHHRSLSSDLLESISASSSSAPGPASVTLRADVPSNNQDILASEVPVPAPPPTAQHGGTGRSAGSKYFRFRTPATGTKDVRTGRSRTSAPTQASPADSEVVTLREPALPPRAPGAVERHLGISTPAMSAHPKSQRSDVMTEQLTTHTEAASKSSIVSKTMDLGDMVALERRQALQHNLQCEAAALDKTAKLMSMFTKRCNAKWPESQKWDLPHVYNVTGFGMAAGGGQANMYRKSVVQMLKEGRYALQVLVGDDYIQMKELRGTPVSLWSSDPWSLISMVQPAKVSSLERVQGVPMGPRLLLSLVNSVEALAGAEAVKNLCVVLHCNEEQKETVVEDLKLRGCCGLSKSNVIVVVERRRPGYFFDQNLKQFVKKLGSSTHQAGNGYNMMQLAWPQGAFILSDEVVEVEAGGIELHPVSEATGGGLKPTDLSSNSRIPKSNREGSCQQLEATVLDYLLEKGAKWLLSRRLHDLSLFHPDSVIDVDSLAYSLFLHEQNGANMVVQVDTVTGIRNAVGIEGLVFTHKSKRSDSRSSGPLSVAEVKGTDLQTPKMMEISAELRSKSKGKLTGSTKRYTFDINLLKGLLVSPAVFRPALIFEQGLVRIKLDASDLSTSAASHCVAMSNRTPAKFFTGPDDAEAVIAAIHAQDSSPAFRKRLGEMAKLAFTAISGHTGSKQQLLGEQARPRTGASHMPAQHLMGSPFLGGTVVAGVAPSSSVASPSRRLPGIMAKNPDSIHISTNTNAVLAGQCLVLLISDNGSTQLAMQLVLSLVKPGKDVLHLVHIVQDHAQEAAGRDLCGRFEAQAKSTLVETRVEVLVKDSLSLVDQLEKHMDTVSADLVVIGSQGLSQISRSAPMGSMAVGLMRNLSRPILIVKSTSKNANIEWSKDKLKCMVQVDHTSRPMLKYVCSKLLNAVRYDKVYLARADARDKAQQETMTARRLLENFSDIAIGLHVEAIKRPLDGSFEEDGCRVADVDRVHIMALQAPISRVLPENIMKLIGKTKSAVLLFKSNEAY
ncbi:hypothetical protein CEUSTIGMA_g3625.t1 [Chlamydomonas eustigma]|uniref:UspA domain-containing protein n=1 Tax=Chlamydomonas eustigma TaxID=1157962 RepID=A0A250WZC4_9CHLO|nr:hypothetical protein CEUSTIGMA_g3625.t1 [Chlamydomonas eustigma]|eukprot:GAX76181.1 hypothetical protein CEUSTIGMA_g3625.t1 [Chlamydomonas eustigma]